MTSIDSLTSLAYALYAGRGTYALLLGSGVSHAAKIPTGRDVVLTLIRRIAGENADPEPNPAAWYQKRFGREPTYSELLEALVPTAADRANILREFFEPTADEQERGEKSPTRAHRAIAQLVANGYVRVVLTTNFDCLIERALDEAGVRPVVVSNPGAVAGAPPLAHSRCTVIKLHGDYLDLATRNTPAELAKYEEPIRDLLARILDEYGLVVCGWSAEHDTALRQALEASPSRRYGAYWAVPGKPREAMQRLIDAQRAWVIPIRDSDTFFAELEEKVGALERLAAPHPLSPAIAVESLKRYLPDEKRRIALDDLIRREVERLVVELGPARFPAAGDGGMTQEKFTAETNERLERYKALTEPCLGLLVSGAWWGEERHSDLWVRAIERLLNCREEHGGIDLWIRLLRYPALLCFYGAGIAAVAQGHYGTLRALIERPAWRDLGRLTPVVQALSVSEVMRGNTMVASRHLFGALREPFRERIPDDRDYELAFDRFEYFFALLQADRGGDEQFGPFDLGRWAERLYRSVRYDPSQVLSKVIEKELQEQGGGWPPVQEGLFSSPARVKEVKAHVDQTVMTQGVGRLIG